MNFVPDTTSAGKSSCRVIKQVMSNTGNQNSKGLYMEPSYTLYYYPSDNSAPRVVHTFPVVVIFPVAALSGGVLPSSDPCTWGNDNWASQLNPIGCTGFAFIIDNRRTNFTRRRDENTVPPFGETPPAGFLPVG